ncbi:MAG: phosphate signaling complex protein PhoU [Deltaproteobacteria bacterium]|nr:phosphate signaling complex protein PhoU [Deltaproteobacteria bacterium]
MERTLDRDLDEIRQSLLRMGGLVEAMLDQAEKSLMERDADLAKHVIKSDPEVDRIEMDLDEMCYSVLARYQPAAVDLRFVAAVIKINNDLERVGDSAVNIAQAVLALSEEPPLKPYIDLPRLFEIVRGMVRDSLDSLVRQKPSQALDVCDRDDQVDGLYKQIFRELLTYMIEDPKVVTRALHLLLISRNLERVADHATNIAEDVIYYVEGRDVRHSAK